MSITHLDLSVRAPRSPRVRLGGFVLLPRALDKARAEIAGKSGEFHFNCPMDRQLFDYFGVDAEALKAEVAKDKTDGELLEWVLKNAKQKATPPEIAAWSHYQESRAPDNTDSREFFNEMHTKYAPHRKDIQTWFDMLDLDDFVSFGGKA